MQSAISTGTTDTYQNGYSLTVHAYNGYRVFPGGKAAGAWC